MKVPDNLRIHGRAAYGTRAVAVYLGGIAPGKVNGWIHSKELGFPKPDLTNCGPDNVSGYSWFPESLPGLRAWYDAYLGMSVEESLTYWKAVDAQLEAAPARSSVSVHRAAQQNPGQEPLF